MRTRDGGSTKLLLVPKIPTNLSYWNAATTDFFGQRPLHARQLPRGRRRASLRGPHRVAQGLHDRRRQAAGSGRWVPTKR
ncbi:hypothetical protein LP420_16565 [Massilia sp. B-10]|nr:hypothetical protein LP420_16565 [Massilia sp. B-10]